MLISKSQFFLKDISEFFKKVDLLKYAEFNINVSFIDKIVISKRANIKRLLNHVFFMLKK